MERLTAQRRLAEFLSPALSVARISTGKAAKAAIVHAAIGEAPDVPPATTRRARIPVISKAATVAADIVQRGAKRVDHRKLQVHQPRRKGQADHEQPENGIHQPKPPALGLAGHDRQPKRQQQQIKKHSQPRQRDALHLRKLAAQNRLAGAARRTKETSAIPTPAGGAQSRDKLPARRARCRATRRQEWTAGQRAGRENRRWVVEVEGIPWKGRDSSGRLDPRTRRRRCRAKVARKSCRARTRNPHKHRWHNRQQVAGKGFTDTQNSQNQFQKACLPLSPPHTPPAWADFIIPFQKEYKGKLSAYSIGVELTKSLINLRIQPPKLP